MTNRRLVTLILAGSVLYGAGPYFSDHLMIAGMGLLIIAVMVLSAAIAQELRRQREQHRLNHRPAPTA